MPGVPLAIDRIMEVVNKCWTKPMPFKDMVVVEAKADGVCSRTSDLLILSPEELCHIYVLAIDASIARGDSDEVLQTWKAYCLSVCFEYTDITSPAFWWSWNYREQLCGSADIVIRTAYQRACEVNAFKLALVKQGISATADYIAGVYSKQSKAIDVSFIRECLSVAEKLCGNPEIWRVMDEFEKRFGIQSCFNSVSKLNKIVEKTEQMWQRTLIFQAIEYAVQEGIYQNSRFTREFLTGGTKDSGSVIAFVPLVLFKWKVRDHLLRVAMPQENLDRQDIITIQEKTKTYATYRACAADETWIGAMQKSSVLAYRIIQAAFQYTFEIRLYNHLSACKPMFYSICLSGYCVCYRFANHVATSHQHKGTWCRRHHNR